MKKLGIAILFLGLSFFRNEAVASIVTFEMSGTIEYLQPAIGLPDPFDGIFTVGQAFTASYTFDTEAPATNVYAPNDISYTGAITRYRIQFGELFAEFDLGGIRVGNDKESAIFGDHDTYVASTIRPGYGYPINISSNIDLPGYDVYFLYFFLRDETGAMFDSAAIPSDVPDLSDKWQTAFLDFRLETGTATSTIGLDVDTLHAVPIPSTIGLLGVGLLGIIRIRRQ